MYAFALHAMYAFAAKPPEAWVPMVLALRGGCNVCSKPCPQPCGFFRCEKCFVHLWHGAAVGSKVVKSHGDGKYCIRFQRDGDCVVYLPVPRTKLQIAWVRLPVCMVFALWQPCTVLCCFLLYARAEASVLLFQLLMCLVHSYRRVYQPLLCKSDRTMLHWCFGISGAMCTVMNNFATGSINNW